jgi:hypothetical protein
MTDKKTVKKSTELIEEINELEGKKEGK